MPRREPDHRAHAAFASSGAPEHEYEQGLWRLRHGIRGHDAVERAMELHQGSLRDGLRGWLLATPKDEVISERTRISLETLKAYRHLFFDVTVFRDHFDLIEWARGLVNDPTATVEGLQYIRWAVMYGIEAMAYMTGLPVQLDSRDVQERAMVDSHFRGLMGRDAPIDSATAKEALKHQQMAVTQAGVLSKAAPPNANSFAVKLKHREMTSSIEFVDKSTEVLH